MASTTAIILVGQAHQNHSGINPTHLIQFTENSRPALILNDLEGKSESIVIVPTLENTIDDIYLMIATFILKQIKPTKDLNDIHGNSMYELFTNDERFSLYKQSFDIFQKNNVKVVFNILDGSLLKHQIDIIKKYPNDFEVTQTTLKKEYNAWSDKI
jgi:hypothetical protein